MNPLTKAVLLELSEIYPASIHYGELLDKAKARVESEGVEHAAMIDQGISSLPSDLLLAYGINLVELRGSCDRFITAIEERPFVSALARRQVALGMSQVTTLSHKLSSLDSFAARLLSLLDGTRDRFQLVEDLLGLVVNGELDVRSPDGERLSDQGEIEERLACGVDVVLSDLRRGGLLERRAADRGSRGGRLRV